MAIDRNKALRDAARKAHRRATDKVSRTKRFHNIDISGTSLDPRTNAREISKMNASELRSYTAKVTGFLSRNVQFSAGAQGAILNHNIWVRQYMPVERAYNKFVTERRAEVDALLLPKTYKGKPETIGQRRSRTNKVQEGGPIYAVGDILNDPYATIHRKPNFIKGDDALLKIIETMKEKMTPEYKAKMIKDDRATIEKALESMGLSDLKSEFASLTDDQFDILFNESSFAEYFFPRYIDMKSKMGQMDDETIQEKREDTLEDIEWVKRVVPTPVKPEEETEVMHPNQVGLASLNTMAKSGGINLRKLKGK
jgi:hypothetical protein